MLIPTMGVLKPGRLLDRIEQGGSLILYTWFLLRLWPEDVRSADSFVFVLFFSEGIVVLLILLRRSTERISLNLRDWFVAISGTFSPLLIGVGGEPLLPNIGVVLLLLGMFIHVAAKFSLRRSFGLVAANRGVKTSGMYGLVRHPMYAGYFVVHVGYLMIAPSIWNLVVYFIVWFFLVARIFAEEKYLAQDRQYIKFQEKVRYRLLPGVF